MQLQLEYIIFTDDTSQSVICKSLCLSFCLLGYSFQKILNFISDIQVIHEAFYITEPIFVKTNRFFYLFILLGQK